MLKEKQGVHTLSVSKDNPCFIIEDGCDDTKHIHIHRKELPRETDAPISKNLNTFIAGSGAKTCTKEMWQPAVVYDFDEWHSVAGRQKKVCIGNSVWLQEAGRWVIDVYEEIQSPVMVTEKPDPHNAYRNLTCESEKAVSKRLCKTYEFIVEGCCDDMFVDGESRGCEEAYIKCTG